MHNKLSVVSHLYLLSPLSASAIFPLSSPSPSPSSAMRRIFYEELLCKAEDPRPLLSILERIIELPAIPRVLLAAGGFPAPEEAPPAHFEVFYLARFSGLTFDLTPAAVDGLFVLVSSTANPLALLVAFISRLGFPGLKKFCSGAPPSLAGGVALAVKAADMLGTGLLLSILCWLVLMELSELVGESCFGGACGIAAGMPKPCAICCCIIIIICCCCIIKACICSGFIF